MKSQLLKKPFPYIALIAAHLIWGTNFVVAKLTLQEIPAMSLAFLRFALALLFLAPFLLAEKKKAVVKLHDLPHLFVVGALMVTLNIALFYEGMARTSATYASILTLIIPWASVLFGWWFLKEKVYVINLMGILAGLGGAVIIIVSPKLVGMEINPKMVLGNFLIILASLAWVVGSILSKPLLERYSTLDLTAVIFFVGVATFSVPAVGDYLQNPSWVSKVTYLGLLGMIFISLLSSVSAYFLFEWGISKLGTIKAHLFQYIEPVVAITMGILLLNEPVGLPFVLGAALIGLGVYWGTLGKEDHHRRHKAHRT